MNLFQLYERYFLALRINYLFITGHYFTLHWFKGHSVHSLSICNSYPHHYPYLKYLSMFIDCMFVNRWLSLRTREPFELINKKHFIRNSIDYCSWKSSLKSVLIRLIYGVSSNSLIEELKEHTLLSKSYCKVTFYKCLKAQNGNIRIKTQILMNPSN